MFIGHFGVGLAAKKAAPSLSLGTLFIAAQFLDLLWPVLLLLNIEHARIVPGITKMTPLDFTDYPVSHSLLTVIGWALLIGLIGYLVRKNMKTAIVLFLCVLSHWFLDLLVHRPDLPLYPGHSEKVGLSLWDNMPVALALESLIFIVGIILYVRSTKPVNRTGNVVLIVLIVFLVLSHIANILGPPPPDMQTIAWAGNLQWLFVILAYWADTNRTPVVS